MTRGRALSFWILVLLLVVAYFFLHLALGLGAVVPDLLTVALLLAGVVFGGVTMAVGMLVHELSVLVVIVNAMRLLRRREVPVQPVSTRPTMADVQIPQRS